MSLCALIFDFDGTILDTESSEVLAWQTIFREHGTAFPDAYWIHAIGRGADEIPETPIQLLERQIGRSVNAARVRETYNTIRMSAIESLEVRHGIRELIDEALAAELALGVASSSLHSWVDPWLDRVGLLESFQVVVCADDVARAKPFPDLYLRTCELLRCGPESAVAIEDSPNGISAAKAAGLACVAIPNACTERLNLSQADLIFEYALEMNLTILNSLLSP